MGMEWGDVRKEIDRYADRKADVTVRMGDMKVSGGSLVLPEPAGSYRHLEVEEHAFGQLCAKLDLPTGYMADLWKSDPELGERCLNHGLQSERNKDKSAFIRASGAQCRAVLSDAYTAVNNKDVVDWAEELFRLTRRGNHELLRPFVNRDGMWLKVLGSEGFDDPSAEGHALRPGTVLGNDETGRRGLTTQGFMFRSFCHNGLIFGKQGVTSINLRHAHRSTADLTHAMRVAVAKGMRAGQSRIYRALELRSHSVEEPIKLIKAIAKKEDMSNAYRSRVLAAFDQEDESTRWGILNAFTRAAQTRRGDTRIEAESHAGKLVDAPESFWQSVVAA